MADDEVTRRDILTAAAVFGGGAAAGYLARDSRQESGQMVIGGGPPDAEQLFIGAGVSVTIGDLLWYGGIVWEENGSLLFDEGDSVGLLEV